MPTTGDSFDIVGGTDQLAQTIAMLQQELLRLRLAELEKPQLYLDEKTRALAGLQQLGSMTGYVQPKMWEGIIGSMYGQKARGASAYIMPPATPLSPEQQKYKIGTEGNVIKTLAQLRQELVTISNGSGGWDKASSEAVLAEYAKVTGYPVAPYTDPATQSAAAPTPPAPTPTPPPPAPEADTGTPPTPPVETSKYTAPQPAEASSPYISGPATSQVKTPVAAQSAAAVGGQATEDPWGNPVGPAKTGNDLWTKMRNAWATGRVPSTAAAWR